MPALLEMTMFGGDTWVDDGYNVFLDDGYNVWFDTTLTVRASHGGYAGEQYWEPFIIDFTPPQYRIDHASGGHCKLGFGTATLTLNAFDAIGLWPPPENCECVIYWHTGGEGGRLLAEDGSYLTTEAGDYLTIEGDIALELFHGTMHRQGLSRNGIVYQFYERAFDVLLLTEETNYDGDTVPLPMAFGAVVHQQPVRLADAGGGNQRYSAGDLTGTKHTDWHVYDDGVDVCANATAISSNVFEYTVAPVGEITISGTGSNTSLIEVFTWACNAARLNQSLDSSLAAAFAPSVWITSQEALVSFLDRLAAYARHLFYLKNDTLYLVAMSADNGSDIALSESEFLPSTTTYAKPVSILKTNWTDRAAVEETIGKYIKETAVEVSVPGYHAYGGSETIDCFQTVKSDVTTSLSNIIGYLQSPRWETAIPLRELFPVPGQKITATDESMGQAISIVIHARDIEYDFDGMLIKIKGEGTVN